MEWREEAVVLAVRPHGEGSAILDVLTANHGRHAGLVRGGSGRKLGPLLQPGAQLQVTWRARLADQLGTFTVDPIRSRAAAILNDRAALAGLNAITALAAFTLAERDADPDFYAQTLTVLDLLGSDAPWPYAYLLWEAALLETQGFGLDLTACAVTGSSQSLAYVSPKSGRAVSTQGAGAWAARLLPLPPCLRGLGPPDDKAELFDALRTTGYFLEHRLRPHLGDRPLPPARQRLLAALSKNAPLG